MCDRAKRASGSLGQAEGSGAGWWKRYFCTHSRRFWVTKVVGSGTWSQLTNGKRAGRRAEGHTPEPAQKAPPTPQLCLTRGQSTVGPLSQPGLIPQQTSSASWSGHWPVPRGPQWKHREKAGHQKGALCPHRGPGGQQGAVTGPLLCPLGHSARVGPGGPRLLKAPHSFQHQVSGQTPVPSLLPPKGSEGSSSPPVWLDLRCPESSGVVGSAAATPPHPGSVSHSQAQPGRAHRLQPGDKVSSGQSSAGVDIRQIYGSFFHGLHMKLKWPQKASFSSWELSLPNDAQPHPGPRKGQTSISVSGYGQAFRIWGRVVTNGRDKSDPLTILESQFYHKFQSWTQSGVQKHLSPCREGRPRQNRPEGG